MGEAEFSAYVAERLPAACDVGASLPALRTADLYVACACIRGDSVALGHVERECIAPLADGLRRLGLSREAIADALQTAREHLLVGREDAPPLIAKYRGTGDLKNWVKVVVLRDGVHSVERKIEVPADNAVLADFVAASVAELETVAATAQAMVAFRTAFAEAVASLEPRERNLLRLNLVHGVSIDRLGAIYAVHRATAARWVERAREKLERGTRERIVQQLGISESECESLLRLAWSRLDASAERVLGE